MLVLELLWAKESATGQATKSAVSARAAQAEMLAEWGVGDMMILRSLDYDYSEDRAEA
jgi:hypothetical protein